jgi:predicted kinase
LDISLSMQLTLCEIESYLKKLSCPKAIILVGLPLSGKDTLLKDAVFDNYKQISRDQLLMDHFEGISDYRKVYSNIDGRFIDKIFFNEINNAALLNENVVINATNLTEKRRRKIRLRFESTHHCIALVMPMLTVDEFVTRNNKRELKEGKTIPKTVFEQMLESYKLVSESEGFDSIIYIQETF